MAYDAPLQLALDRLGGPSALARALGVVPSAVTNWHRVPAARAGEVSRLTGIPVHEIRPDLFPAPAKAERQCA